MILYGDTSKCSKLDEEKSFSTTSEIWNVIMLTPSWPFLHLCLRPCQQPRQRTPEGWEKLRHRWAVHNIVYVPDSSFRCWKLVAHWQHTGDNLKNCFRNMDSLSEGNQWRKCSGNQIGGNLGVWGLLGATGGYWGLLGGYLKCAIAQHWMSESKVGQCLGASWDLLNSRYVPYLPIRSWFWAVRAWKEKFPRFKYIGLPTHFP